MQPFDPKTISIERLLSRMDLDCAIRATLSALGGKKKFFEQMSLECNIMAERLGEEEPIEEQK